MAGLGWQELVIVLVIVMIIFGAGKLPEVAKSLGQGVKEFKNEANQPLEGGTTSTTAAAADSVADGKTETVYTADGPVVETRQMRADEV